MTDQYDVAVVGGGHNGLVAAAYLARSGRKVVVLEASDKLGGAAGTARFHDGYSVSECAHLIYALHPTVVKDLSLEAHGLEYAARNLSTISLARDGNHVTFSRETISGKNLSEADVAGYKAFYSRMTRFARLLGSVLTERPPRLADNDLSDKMTLVKLAVKVRMLGRDGMRELLRVGAINIHDVLEEQFDNDALKGALALDAVLGSFAGPRSPNTVLGYLYRHAGEALGAEGPCIPAGGMGAVTGALAGAAKQFGAELRTNCRVDKIQVKDCAVTGIELSNGETIGATSVVSNADPKVTFAKLIGYPKLEIEFSRRIHNIRTRGTAAKLHLALDGLPDVPTLTQDDLGQRLVIAPGLTYVERAFDHVKYGEPSENPVMEISIPTIHDKSLAPEGKHVLSAVVQYLPCDLKTGDWAERRNSYRSRIIDTIEEYLPGLKDRIVARELLTPADIENRFGNTGGHWHHGEFALDQFLMMRPVPGAAQYSTPVDGLFLCSAGCHPGGGVMGVAGKNCARAVMSRGVRP